MMAYFALGWIVLGIVCAVVIGRLARNAEVIDLPVEELTVPQILAKAAHHREMIEAHGQSIYDLTTQLLAKEKPENKDELRLLESLTWDGADRNEVEDAILRKRYERKRGFCE